MAFAAGRRGRSVIQTVLLLTIGVIAVVGRSGMAPVAVVGGRARIPELGCTPHRRYLLEMTVDTGATPETGKGRLVFEAGGRAVDEVLSGWRAVERWRQSDAPVTVVGGKSIGTRMADGAMGTRCIGRLMCLMVANGPAIDRITD